MNNLADSIIASRYRFGPITHPVALSVDAIFLDRLMRATRGWTVSPWTGDSMPPSITMTRENDTYVISSPSLDKPLRYADEADAICMFLLELIGAYAAARPDLFFLHAGAALVGETLIVFPASGQAGKSTLIANLGAAGAAIWADDAFPVSLDRRTGSALGIAPRPRRPWPASFAEATRTFLDGHIAVANERFAYIALPAGNQAALGTEKPIGAFMLPERVDDGAFADPIELAPASRAETMTKLIGQHLGKPPPARAMVEKLAALLAGVPCWRLKYRQADTVARYLVAHPACSASR